MSTSEWPIACRSGAEIIDFKEPSRGALAPTDPELWQWAAKQPRCPAWLSAAMGEPSDALEIAEQVPSHFRFAKVGPSGCDTLEKLTEMWTTVHERLTPPIELVAVAYADANDARCLDVEKVLAAARSHGFTRVLIDTFTKDGRSTIDHLGFRRLAAISRWATEKRIWWGLAGSIKLESMSDLSGHGLLRIVSESEEMSAPIVVTGISASKKFEPGIQRRTIRRVRSNDVCFESQHPWVGFAISGKGVPRTRSTTDGKACPRIGEWE